MKNIEIRIVDSITDALDQIQSQIRVHAYEKFLSRGQEPNLALDDWLDAERELVSVLTANINQEEDQIVAEVEISNIEFETLYIQSTSQEALIDIPLSDSGRRAFGVIRFDQQIDPERLQAFYSDEVLRLIVPTAGAAKMLTRTA